MSRLLNRVKDEQEKEAVVQKTVRVPLDLYNEFEKLMKEASIDSFNKAVVKLIELEVEDWKKACGREN